MKHTLADVALPVPLRQSFTYIVPPDLAPRVAIGSRVLVPFGKKQISGIVVGFPTSTSIGALKPIQDVLDILPALSPQLLKLGSWISEYYAAPLGEVLKAFLPQGISIENKKMISLKRTTTRDELARFGISAPQRATVINALSADTPLSIAQLQKRTGIKSIYSILSALGDAGIIAVSDHLSEAKTKPKLENFLIRKNIPTGFAPQGKIQQKLLARIAQLTDEPYPVRLLLRETGAALSSLKGFITKEIVEVVQQEIERSIDFLPDAGVTPVMPVQLTAHQLRALQEIGASIESEVSTTFLLYGITGSGKTQVYIEAIRQVLAKGKTAIVLVPEISLTPQIVRRFRLHFGNSVAVMHSRMSDGERYDAWRSCKSGKYKIVIGPRSAVFAPLENLGLVVVDEEHEASYKQFDASPRYNARDVAIMRGNHAGAVIVLGSATPSIESFYNARTEKYTLLELPERIDNAVLPSISLVNMGDDHKRRYAAMKEEAAKIGRKAFEKGSTPSPFFWKKRSATGCKRKKGSFCFRTAGGLLRSSSASIAVTLNAADNATSRSRTISSKNICDVTTAAL